MFSISEIIVLSHIAWEFVGESHNRTQSFGPAFNAGQIWQEPRTNEVSVSNGTVWGQRSLPGFHFLIMPMRWL